MGSIPSRRGMFLLFIFLSISYLSTTHGRVLVRPFTTALSQYGDELFGGVQTYNLLDTDSNSQIEKSITSLDHGIDDISSYITSKRLHRRAGKQPSPATDSQFTASTAKGCCMLYMLAASAEDALIRMKTNPKLLSLASSQSKWDNAGALEQYGWTETKNDVNWAYMGVNDVMKDLEIDTANRANSSVQLVQDQAVEVDGTKFVASKGTYSQAINVEAGLMVPYYIFSPGHEARANNIKGEIVPLAQYSDVMFLEYSKLCSLAKQQVSGLKYMLALNIENRDT